MFQMKDEMQTAVKHNIRGGDGSPSFRYLFSAEQLGNRAEMMAVITLRPGESVGVHPHETNGEAYYILEGAATVTEDGESVGTLEDILETPASQIYVVKGETEHLIPAVDEFIVRVDAENAVVTVRLIEGM